MTREPDDIEEIVAGLAMDPVLSPFAGGPEAVLVWDRAGERLIGASASATALREALSTGEGGVVDPSWPGLPRVQALAASLPVGGRARLERIRFDATRLSPPRTCACRVILLSSGRPALVMAILGEPPVLTHRNTPSSGRVPAAAREPRQDSARELARGTDRPRTGQQQRSSELARDSLAPPSLPPAEAINERPDPIAHLQGRGTIRFIWQADAGGRFTQVSAPLAEIVGLRSAAIIGRTWNDIVGDVVDDPADAVSGLFARRDAWSGCRVWWRIDGTDLAVEVDFAGEAVHDRDQRLVGWRGFALVRTDGIVARIRPVEPLDDNELFAAFGTLASLNRPDIRGPASVENAPTPGAGVIPADDAPASLPSIDKAPAMSDEVAATDEAEDSKHGLAALLEERGLDEPDRRDMGSEEGVVTKSLSDVPLIPSMSEIASHRPANANEAPASKLANGAPGKASPGPPAPEPAFAGLQGQATARLGENKSIPPRGGDAPESPDAGDRAPGDQPPADAVGEGLSTTERSAFREIARALGARHEEPAPEQPRAEPTRLPEHLPTNLDPTLVLERLPIGVLVHRGEEPLFANRIMLDLLGYAGIAEFAADGGVERLFPGRMATLGRFEEGLTPIALSIRAGETIPVEARLATFDWGGSPASLMLIRRLPDVDPGPRLRALELDLRARESRLHELSAILDTATDGVVVIDNEGRILSLNRSAEALFGYEQNEVAGENFAVLFAPESHAVSHDYLDGLRANGVASLFNDGREVLGRVRQGGTIPLFMTIGRINDGPERKFCAVLRDITAFKKAEGELVAAKRAAEEANAHKSDFLAKISHEIRTPLNAIIGFAEVMLEERFGPVGNERYKDYLKDVHASGGHVVSLVNDLLDLAKIEAGRMELAFTSVDLNELVGGCVALMQPQVSRERIVMRTSFAPKLPPVVADERSLKQIALNIVSNAVKFTDAGGQVIVSTAVTDRGEVAFRVRDTGIGMTDEEVTAALEPFRQLSTKRRGGGTGLGLPLTKALVEANRGALHITSARNEGTLVEVLFPPTRVLAE